jgi:WD40 repeat protein
MPRVLANLPSKRKTRRSFAQEKKRARLDPASSATEKRLLPIKKYEEESDDSPSPIKFVQHSSRVSGVAAQAAPSAAQFSPESTPAIVPRAWVPVLRHGARGLRGDPIALQRRLVALLFVLDKVDHRLSAPTRRRLSVGAASVARAERNGALAAGTKTAILPRLATALLNYPSAAWAIDALDGRSTSIVLMSCLPADYILTVGQGAQVFCAALLTTRCPHDGAQLVATGDAEGGIQVWSLGERREQCEWQFLSEREAPVVMLVSVDGGVRAGEVLVAGYDSGAVELWSVERRVCLGLIPHADGSLSSAHGQWTPTLTAEAIGCVGAEVGDALLLMAGWDGNVKLFGARLHPQVAALMSCVDPTPLCVLRSTYKARHTDTITCSLLVDKGTRLVTGGRDAALNVWSLPTSTPWDTIETPSERDQIAYALTGHDAGVRCLLELGYAAVAPSPWPLPAVQRAPPRGSPARIVSGASDAVLRVWTLGATSGTCVAKLIGHDGPVTALVALGLARCEIARVHETREWVADGGSQSAAGRAHAGRALLVASASADGTARIWRVEDDSTWQCSCVLDSLAGGNGLVALTRLDAADRVDGAVATTRGGEAIEMDEGGESSRSDEAESDHTTQSDELATAAGIEQLTPMARQSSSASANIRQRNSSSSGGAGARSPGSGLFSTQCFVMCGDHPAAQLASPPPPDTAQGCLFAEGEIDNECDFAEADDLFSSQAMVSPSCSAVSSGRYATTTMLRTEHAYDQSEHAPVRLLTAAMDGTLRVWNVSEALRSRTRMRRRPRAQCALQNMRQQATPRVDTLDVVV